MNKLEKFQKLLAYSFNNKDLLKQALTTPQFANQKDINDYEVLETIGDAVIKLIFLMKKYKLGISSPGKLTRLKQQLENDNTLIKIAQEYFKLENYIFKAKKQKIKGSKILADVFEAVCGALFIDSKENISIVERIIIDKFYDDWDSIIEGSPILNKNKLLEFLQSRLRFTPIIETDLVSKGPDNSPIWIAKNARIYTPNHKLIKRFTKKIKSLSSEPSKTKKDAEQDLYWKMLNVLEE
ncbi:MAG: hypothetical protein EU547_01480 [Promethearchaeota archaeon]|nr:MAG: hypothetical protein EU547_01480 [Candidatus Lokiarchaeota archaeon]